MLLTTLRVPEHTVMCIVPICLILDIFWTVLAILAYTSSRTSVLYTTQLNTLDCFIALTRCVLIVCELCVSCSDSRLRRGNYVIPAHSPSKPCVCSCSLQRHLHGTVYLTMSLTAKVIPVFIQTQNYILI